MLSIILASKSKVRKEILEKNNIRCIVEPSNVDEEPVKNSLLNEGATPEVISKNFDLDTGRLDYQILEPFVIRFGNGSSLRKD